MMMIHLGPLEAMVGIKCPTVQRVETAGRMSFRTTLGGVVKAQAGPVGRRSWDVNLGKLSTPSDVGVLMEFADGVWGPGPFWFVPADAPVVNLLPPADASCNPNSVALSDGGELIGTPPMDLGSGRIIARSIWKTSAGVVSFNSPVPVRVGEPVTGAAWVQGTGSIRLSFLDANGDHITYAGSRAGSGATERLAVTTIAPPNAKSAILWATSGITRLGRPAITWTDQPFQWGDGQGCPKAVIHGTSRDLVKALRGPHDSRWSEISFTIQEVG